MASVPGEFDATYGLDADDVAVIEAGKTGEGKKKPEPVPADEREDQEREAREREQAERDTAAAAALTNEGGRNEDEAEQRAEERARKLGWVPRDEYRGSKEWVPASEWLERGYGNNQILRDLNDKLDGINNLQAGEIRELRRQQEESQQVLRSINSRFESAEKSGYDRAVKELKKEQREAVESADTAAYDAATEKLKTLEDGGPPKPLAPARTETDKGTDRQTEQRPQIDPGVVAWANEPDNQAIMKDSELRTYMSAIDTAFTAKNQAAGRTVDAKSHLNEIKAELKRRYPEKFTNARRDAPNSVGRSGGDPDGGRANGSSKPRNQQRIFENLPADAKEACLKQIRSMGKGKDGKDYYTKEKYCAVYEWPAEFYA